MGLLQALGIVAYVIIFVFLAQKVVPMGVEIGPVVGPMLFLLAFVTFALVCGSITFLYPAVLFFGDKRREAVRIVIWTTGWLVLAFAISAAAVIAVSR